MKIKNLFYMLQLNILQVQPQFPKQQSKYLLQDTAYFINMF